MKEYIYNYLEQDASIIFLNTNLKGEIIHHNRYAGKIFGDRLKEKNIKSLFLDFNGPLKVNDRLNSPNPHLLNVNTKYGLPETFYFRFFKNNDQIYILGEQNNGEADKLRKELIDINNNLSNLTRELHKKNAELKKLNDLKDHFLNAAAHDLRNPVGNIIRLSDFLLLELSDKLNSQQLQFLRLIKSLSNFGLNLLNDLLDLAKIESGKLALNKSSFDLIELIKEIIQFNRYNADKKNIHLKVEAFEKIDLITADKSGIQQVLDNMINNAIKFSPVNSQVSVGLFNNNENITIYVKDTGPGIPEEDLDKLFIPFSRTSVKVTGDEKSTGLGLAIVKKIIVSHNGKIWVQSKIGEGTTFYFSIPKS